MNTDDDTKPPDSDFELSQGEDLPPLPPNVPPDFRARLALALKTTAPELLAAAEEGYRGIYPGCDEYIREVIADELPPHLQWLLSCTMPERLRAGYENDTIVVWGIPLGVDRVMVFESLRHGETAYQVPMGSTRITVYAKPEPR